MGPLGDGDTTGGWAALGAAASATVSADMETIDAALLSRRTPPLERQLAGDYAALEVVRDVVEV
jgi:hypothetical protein